MGLSFISGLLWSICSITLTQNKIQVVAGIGVIGISAIGGTGSFLIYLLSDTNSIETGVLTINVRERPDVTIIGIVLYEGDSINIATGENTPIKIVVFEPHSPIKDQAIQL
jgi:hypothetical protein